MSETIFPYKPKFRITSAGSGIIVPIFLIAIPIVYPFSITLGGFTIVPYPWTILLFCLAALGFFWSFASKLRRYTKLKGHDCTIRVVDGTVHYKEISKGQVKDASFELADVSKVKFDEEEAELEVTVTDADDSTSYYTFEMRYFQTQEDFDTFVAMLKS